MLKPKEGLDVDYLCYSLMFYKVDGMVNGATRQKLTQAAMTEHFRAIAPAGTQPNLNTAIMKAYKQVIPPIELQRDFIRFANQVDKSKVAVLKIF